MGLRARQVKQMSGSVLIWFFQQDNQCAGEKSEILASLEPNLVKGAETLGGLIGKMMLAAEVSALSRGLTKTYAQMAERGGAQLLYVQIRALANKAAENALKKSGSSGLEAGVFRNLLEQVGKRLPKGSR
jgi:hypothetical protein